MITLVGNKIAFFLSGEARLQDKEQWQSHKVNSLLHVLLDQKIEQ